MKYAPLSVNCIVNTYKLHLLGAGYLEMKEKAGAKSPTQVVDTVDKFLKEGFSYVNSRNENYAKAIEILKQEGVTVKKETPVKVEEKVTDPFQHLEDAFNAFTLSVSAFIEAQVEKKCAEVREELKEQKEANMKLLETVEEAKVPNWITSLKQKFS